MANTRKVKITRANQFTLAHQPAVRNTLRNPNGQYATDAEKLTAALKTPAFLSYLNSHWSDYFENLGSYKIWLKSHGWLEPAIVAGLPT